MKKLAIVFSFALIFLGGLELKAQVKQNTEKMTIEKPYNPVEDAQKKINDLLKQAKRTNKYVILQAGGNWCSWCLLFNNFIKTNVNVNKVLKKKYLYYHLNFSKENKNEVVFKKYSPDADKLGYPFFIVLNDAGNVVKIQESSSLEQGKGYNEAKVLAFLNSVKK